MTTADIAGARQAGHEDLDAIVELATLVVAELADERGGASLLFHDLGSVGDRSTYQRALSLDEELLVVGTIDDIVVGYGLARQVRSSASLVCMIDELVVHPSARAIGVGAEVLASLREWAVGSGCQAIECHVLPGNRNAKNFFERVGMVTRKMQVSTRL